MAGEVEGGSGQPQEGIPPRREEDERPPVPEREQPVERREDFRPEEVVSFIDRQFQERQRRFKELDDYIAAHPRVQQQFREDPEQYLAAYKKILDDLGVKEFPFENLVQQGIERGVGERAGAKDGPPGPAGEGWQWVEVKSSVGIPRYVKMPIADEGKRYYVGEVLARIEATPEAEGGFTDRLSLEEIALAITAIIENPEKYSQDQNLGQELKKKFLARLRVHGVYQQFSKASTAKDVVQILSPVTADELNTLFKEIPEVVKAFLLLEDRAEEFLKASEKDREKIRKEIANETIGEKPNIKGLRDIDTFWAQRIGERLWEITGRRAARDRLVPTELKPGQDPEEALKDAYNEYGKVTFLGRGANAGNFHVRRALQFKRWVRQTSEVHRPFLQLLDGWDLAGKDLFTRLVETTYEAKKQEDYGNQLMTLEQKKKLADKVAKIFKNQENKDGKPLPLPYIIDEKKEDIKWPIMANWEEIPPSERPKIGERRTKSSYADYLQDIDWSQVDFMTIGGGRGSYPLLEWALYQISLPTDAIGTIIGEAKKFLQNPTYESLKEAENAFLYKGPASHDIKGALFTNYLNFAGMDYQKELGRRNFTKMELDRIIGNATSDKFISAKKAQVLRDELFELKIPGISKPFRWPWLREVKTLLYSTSWLGGLWGFIKEFIKSAFSIK